MCSSEARSPFVPCLPQMTSFITEKVQLILTHNVREEEKSPIATSWGPLEAVDGWVRWKGSRGREGVQRMAWLERDSESTCAFVSHGTCTSNPN